ncbi:hypothetical protein D3C87_410150 [compost metagenome]
MKNIKLTYLIFSNLLIFYLIHKLVFSSKMPDLLFNLLLSFSCLNFVIITTNINRNFDKRKIWFIISEWAFGFVLICFLNYFLSEKFEITFWISIFIISIMGGILTAVNFSKTFDKQVDLKKYTLKLIILSITFPLIDLLYFSLFYHRTFYDLSFYVFIPQILIVIIWQIFNYFELSLANKSSN